MFVDMDGTLTKPLYEGVPDALTTTNLTLTPDRPTLHVDGCHILGG